MPAGGCVSSLPPSRCASRTDVRGSGGGRLRAGVFVLGPLLGCLVLGCLGVAHADGDGRLTEAELARARAARASVARVRWRDGRFGDRTITRNAIVVRADGLLLIAGLAPTRDGTYTAVLPGGRQMRARVVGTDAETALTLLRVPSAGLVPLAGAAPAAETTAGTRLLPPGLGSRVLMVTGDGAVAAGAVRAHGRAGRIVDPRTRRAGRTTGLVGVAIAAVDADAGAPLLDERGHLAALVVGRKDTVETAPGTRAPGALRVRPTPVEAVAVPAAVVRLAWPLLARFGRLPRAGLGVQTLPADEALRRHLGLASGGHLVEQVRAEGPAARAGLRRHDVIVAVGGVAVPVDGPLHDVLLPHRPGETVRLAVVRGGKRLAVEVRLGDRDAR